MPLEIRPATHQDDAAVVELFQTVEVPISARYWQRSFDPDQPAEWKSTPFVAMDHHGKAVAFCIARPRTLLFNHEQLPAQILHELVFHPMDIFPEGQREFLQEVVQRSEFTVVAGAGLELTRILDRERFLRAGAMERWRVPADMKTLKNKNTPELTTGIPDSGELTDLIHRALVEENRFHFRRDPESFLWMHGWPGSESREVIQGRRNGVLEFVVVSRTARGTKGDEMHLVDGIVPEQIIEEMMQALMEKSTRRGMPLYLSFFGGSMGSTLGDMGVEQLRPRWPIYWMIRDPKQRSLMNILLRKEHWHFFPADGEIDHH
ncbi:MAG: hypothetical protein SFY68_03585 [Candidatus Sumerlaeia bacterium]|nr:hypothetical protein [Candidatus Sumerlaeia bacterium]